MGILSGCKKSSACFDRISQKNSNWFSALTYQDNLSKCCAKSHSTVVITLASIRQLTSVYVLKPLSLAVDVLLVCLQSLVSAQSIFSSVERVAYRALAIPSVDTDRGIQNLRPYHLHYGKPVSISIPDDKTRIHPRYDVVIRDCGRAQWRRQS